MNYKKAQKKLKFVLILFFVVVFSGLLFTIVYAQPIDYTPLSPLPNVDTSNGLVGYVNSMFKLFIMLSIILAVFMITFAGIQYMVSSAAGSKESAKSRIRNAFFGLALALFAWIFLFQINPSLVNFSIEVTPEELTSAELADKPTEPGWYYLAFDRADNDKLIYKGRVETGSGFVTESICNAVLNTDENSFGDSCKKFPREDGPWYFIESSGNKINGYYATQDICIDFTEKVVLRGFGVKNFQDSGVCLLDIERAKTYGVLEQGWYFSFTNAQGQNNLRGPYNDKGDCDKNRDRLIGNDRAGRYVVDVCNLLDKNGDVISNEAQAEDLAATQVDFDRMTADEERVRGLLKGDIPPFTSVTFNNDPCKSLTSNGCTNVGTLPKIAIDGLLFLKENSNWCDNSISCIVQVTGGTEWWLHKTHGLDLPIVDLNTSMGGASKSKSPLDNKILSNAGVTLGVGVEPTDRTSYIIQLSPNVVATFTYERTGSNDKNTGAHWHVVFSTN